MKVNYLSLLLLAALCLSGCRKAVEPSAPPDPTESAEFKALLWASGGAYFERTLPGDLKPDDSVYVVLAYPDGTKQQVAVLVGGGPGIADPLTVCVFRDSYTKKMSVAILSDSLKVNAPIPEAFTIDTISHASGKTRGAFSDFLMQFVQANTANADTGTTSPTMTVELILSTDPVPAHTPAE